MMVTMALMDGSSTLSIMRWVVMRWVAVESPLVNRRRSRSPKPSNPSWKYVHLERNTQVILVKPYSTKLNRG
jgi:hypothetical protein